MVTEWEKKVKYALNHQKQIESLKLKKEKHEFYNRLRKLVPIPILIGIIAAIGLVSLSGFKYLIEVILTWIIGLTIVATIIAYLPKRIQK